MCNSLSNNRNDFWFGKLGPKLQKKLIEIARSWLEDAKSFIGFSFTNQFTVVIPSGNLTTAPLTALQFPLRIRLQGKRVNLMA